MPDISKSFAEEAYADLQRMRDEILKRYPDASYLRERYGVTNVMSVEFPDDAEGERVYQSFISKVATLKFS